MGIETPTHDRWLALVGRTLKGAGFDKLVARSADGLAIQPLYDAADGTVPAGRGARPWRIAQRLDHPDPAQASALALADLEGGADEIVVSLAGSATARGFGVEAGSVEALDRALAGVKLDLVRLRLETAPFDGRAAAECVVGLAARRGHDPAQLSIDFGLDPASDMGRAGGLPMAWPELAKRFAGTAAFLRDKGFTRTLARADGRAAHEAGASEAQELAFVLASGVAYLRALEAGGFTLDEARRAIGFLMVADADEFLTIGKLRAMRLLWVRVETACGLAPRPIDLAAETAWRMTARRDPHTNMLRSALAAFSAGVGGADGICVLPFTAALGLPDAFARRVARNLQHVLVEEAHLWRVADPAAGSGTFETLTRELAGKAWALFQEIEAEGGIVASLAAGKPQSRIGAVAMARAGAVAHRRTPLTGISEFALLIEAPARVLEVLTPAHAPPALADRFTPLPSTRLAEPFERWRDRSDDMLAHHGRRPTVFLANLGSAAGFTARRMFARSLFEGGGIATPENHGPATIVGIVEGFRASGATVACLCASDDGYARQGAEAVRLLKGAGAARIVVAVRPADLAATFADTPPDLYVFAGCDALAVFDALADELFGRKA